MTGKVSFYIFTIYTWWKRLIFVVRSRAHLHYCPLSCTCVTCMCFTDTYSSIIYFVHIFTCSHLNQEYNNNNNNNNYYYYMCAAATLSLDDEFFGLEVLICSAVLEEALTLPISTIAHIPRSVRPLLATVIAAELRHAHSGNTWGFVRLQLFAKAVL